MFSKPSTSFYATSDDTLCRFTPPGFNVTNNKISCYCFQLILYKVKCNYWLTTIETEILLFSFFCGYMRGDWLVAHGHLEYQIGCLCVANLRVHYLHAFWRTPCYDMCVVVGGRYGAKETLPKRTYFTSYMFGEETNETLA